MIQSHYKSNYNAPRITPQNQNLTFIREQRFLARYNIFLWVKLDVLMFTESLREFNFKIYRIDFK